MQIDVSQNAETGHQGFPALGWAADNCTDLDLAEIVAGTLLRLQSMKREIFRLVVLITLAGDLVRPGVAWARNQGAPDGARLYREYCASCHGLSGKGDGPDAAIFTAPPRNLREGFLQKYKTADLVRRVREGRPLELALDLPALRAQATQVEAIVGHLKQLPIVKWTRTTHGEVVYVDRCALCHGMYGRPGTPLPPGVRSPRDLSDPAFQRSIDDEELTTLVRHGRQGMPALTPRVSASDAQALAQFVRLLSAGYEMYSRYCASCHGDDGHREGSLAEGLSRPTVVFDRAYLARCDPECLRAQVWHMLAEEKPAMPHYRILLDDAKARAIIEYLKHIS